MLGEEILGAFSVSAGLKFESGIASWVGKHFLDIVKVVLWAVGLSKIYSLVSGGREKRWLAILAIGAAVAGLGLAGISTRYCPLAIPLGIVVAVLVWQVLSTSNILTLAWRELSSWLLSPLGYVVAAGFAIMAGRMFVVSMAELTAMRPGRL